MKIQMESMNLLRVMHGFGNTTCPRSHLPGMPINPYRFKMIVKYDTWSESASQKQRCHGYNGIFVVEFIGMVNWGTLHSPGHFS